MIREADAVHGSPGAAVSLPAHARSHRPVAAGDSLPCSSRSTIRWACVQGWIVAADLADHATHSSLRSGLNADWPAGLPNGPNNRWLQLTGGKRRSASPQDRSAESGAAAIRATADPTPACRCRGVATFGTKGATTDHRCCPTAARRAQIAVRSAIPIAPRRWLRLGQLPLSLAFWQLCIGGCCVGRCCIRRQSAGGGERVVDPSGLKRCADGHLETGACSAAVLDLPASDVLARSVGRKIRIQPARPGPGGRTLGSGRDRETRAQDRRPPK